MYKLLHFTTKQNSNNGTPLTREDSLGPNKDEKTLNNIK